MANNEERRQEEDAPVTAEETVPSLAGSSVHTEIVGMDGQPHTTTALQTFLHLAKGYIGPGCLSLPWAVSQLGIGFGCFACCFMGYWTSYNSWSVVRLKRIRMRQINEEGQPDTSSVHSGSQHSAIQYQGHQHPEHTHITYPQVVKWLYGKRFENFTTLCICVQQLSVCTVFLSFVGANLKAVLEALWEVDLTHAMVVTLVTPAAASLSLLPDLKSLAPATAIGTALLSVGLLILSVVMCLEWNERPTQPIHVNWYQAPLALCAILYSYEGICLILPVESAMEQPKRFKYVFVNAIVVSAVVFSLVAGLSVAAFGKVTNGSITAFLLEAYSQDPQIQSLMLVANAAVSLSVLVTYPLQLFPCLELVAKLQWFSRRTEGFVSVQDGDFVAAEHVLADEASTSLDGSGLHRNLGTGSDEGSVRMDNDADSTAATNLENSWKTRLGLVLLTYFIAVVVPNVQALISLAGALAGSSTALLIPPILQIAWMRQNDLYSEHCWEIYRSYVLLAGGIVFLVIGTVASLTDIVHIYLSSSR